MNRQLEFAGVIALAISSSFVTAAERPADTQPLDRLNHSSQQALVQLQRRDSKAASAGNTLPPPATAATASAADRFQQSRQRELQEAQRQRVLRQHYRSKMSSQPVWQQRMQGISRQRGFQRQQESQLRTFGRQRR
jgi:hypothetical protein